MKDVNFYDRESVDYSGKRYPKKTSSYTQFFFRKRLSIVLKFLDSIVTDRRDISLLEIGCADGVVIDSIYKRFPNTFSKMIGIDTSPKMIEVARNAHKDNPFTFEVRENFSDNSPKDVIVEVGVINYAGFLDELDFSSLHLKSGGIYIISLAGTDSIWNKLKKEGSRYKNFLSYADYEQEMRKKFDIIRISSVGLFIPYLWKVSVLGRLLQPLETILRPLAPNIFHEKVYLLKKK